MSCTTKHKGRVIFVIISGSRDFLTNAMDPFTLQISQNDLQGEPFQSKTGINRHMDWRR